MQLLSENDSATSELYVAGRAPECDLAHNFEIFRREEDAPQSAVHWTVMRLFVGIPLPAAVEAELSTACRRLRSENNSLRWPAPESWHITLQFLGNATVEQFECLAQRLAEVRSPPVAVRLGGLGVFDRSGVLLAEVEPTAGLVALAQRVTAETAACGFAAEQRPYRPHITLARAKGEAGRCELQALKARIHQQPALPNFVAEEFLVYESHLGPGGSKYEARQRVRLGPLR